MLSFIGYAFQKINRAFYVIFIEPVKISMLNKHGKNIRIQKKCELSYSHICCGDYVSIGSGCMFMSSIANIIINDHVMFAPNVTIITGDHRLDLKGRLLDSVQDYEKLPENDQDVVFLGDNWVGTGAIILKGVTVGKGAVISAGAVVVKDVPDYSIVGGIPARVISHRREIFE